MLRRCLCRHSLLLTSSMDSTMCIVSRRPLGARANLATIEVTHASLVTTTALILTLLSYTPRLANLVLVMVSATRLRILDCTVALLELARNTTIRLLTSVEVAAGCEWVAWRRTAAVWSVSHGFVAIERVTRRTGWIVLHALAAAAIYRVLAWEC